MKNEAQQATISAHGKKDLQDALRFHSWDQNGLQLYSGTAECQKYVCKWHSYSLPSFFVVVCFFMNTPHPPKVGLVDMHCFMLNEITF